MVTQDVHNGKIFTNAYKLCFQHVSYNFNLDYGAWELQAENVCYKAKGKNYGVIRFKKEGLLKGIKLEHISGYLTCGVGVPDARSLWGCHTAVRTLITDANNRVVFPANIDNPLHSNVPVYDAKTSQILVFTNFAYPSFFVKGQELRIWYSEDLYDYTTHDNGGKHCIKVYAKF